LHLEWLINPASASKREKWIKVLLDRRGKQIIRLLQARRFLNA
jgi:hypothetical protein